MVRTQSAGVFVGRLESPEGTDVVLLDARRMWYWQGAASLSELATRGTSKPSGCKFPAPVSRIHLFGVIEILDVTTAAMTSIRSVPAWTD